MKKMQQNKNGKTAKKESVPFMTAVSVNCKAVRLLIKHQKGLLLSRILYQCWAALTPYAGIYLSALLIGELAGARDEGRLTGLVILSLVSAVIIGVVRALLNRLKNARSAGLYYKLRDIYTDKLLRMDYASLDDTKTHELLSTIRQNENGGGWGLYRVVNNVETLASSLFTLLGGIALTVTLFTSRVPETAGGLVILNHPLFAVGTVCCMLALTCLAPWLSVRAEEYYARHADSHRLGNRLFGYYGWLGYKRELAADMRIYRQDLICDRHNSDKHDIFGSKGLFAHYSKGPIGLYSAASAAVSVVFSGLVYVFVCFKAWAGAFGVGAVTQYVASVTKLSGGLSSLLGTLGDMRHNAAFLCLTFDFLAIGDAECEGHKQLPCEPEGGYEIEFRDVSFRYPGSENYALRHVTARLRPGERIAVVGRNGSGKTTFIKLMCRLYDPTEGSVLLCGTDIREFDRAEYLRLFSVVFQDFQLFSYPLGENVAGCETYDAEKVTACLEKSGFGERLSGMDKGLATRLYKDLGEDGVDLSGGEAQKIALARALYKDAPVIVLDEPTAALDPIAESEIYSHFNEIVGNKTAVYISHRLSSCRFCRDILVFDNGELVERGGHDALLAADGQYSRLWNAQAKYYASEETKNF